MLVVVSLVTPAKPEEELRGLVWGLDREPDQRRGASTSATASGGARRGCSAASLLALLIVLNIIFI